jgi:hypothetical protein
MPSPSEHSDAAPGLHRPATSATPPLSRTRRALVGLADALCAATPSMDTVRDAAVRYGTAARAVALAPEEMAGALQALLRRCAERHAPAVRAELEASVPWWAIHGYHRAD